MFRNKTILRNSDIQIKGTVSYKVASGTKHLDISDRLRQEKENVEEQILKAQEEYQRIISETKNQKESILMEANEQAKLIEKKAYECGYEQGLKNGYEDGYKESYKKHIDEAIEESRTIKEKEYENLLNIKNVTYDYLKSKKEELLKVCISIAEQVLREKFNDTDSMRIMLENLIKEYDLKSDLIIKVNPIYAEGLQSEVNSISGKFKLSQKIFIFSDLGIDKGNAEIETNGGKLTVGINSVLDKVKAELL